MGWTLRQSYTLIAPAYDWVVGRAFQGARAESLRQLPAGAGAEVLMVVPDSATCLREAARVTKPKAELLVLDKFLRPGQHASFRKALNGLARHIATRTDVVFEHALARVPGLSVVQDEAVLLGGWSGESSWRSAFRACP